jgi:hypothetical protein
MTAQTLFEVQIFTICDGWINNWSTTDAHGSRTEAFESYAAAEAEINEYLDDSQLEIQAGERSADEGYDRKDFRIVEITFR